MLTNYKFAIITKDTKMVTERLRLQIYRELKAIQKEDPDKGFLEEELYRFNERGFNRLRQSYRDNVHTPDFQTDFWQKLWAIWGSLVDGTVQVSHCDRSREEIAQFETEDRGLIYLPQILSTDGARPLLTRITDLPEDYFEGWKPFFNYYPQHGWLDIEWSAKTPYLNTTEPELIEYLAGQQRVMQTLNTYIVGAMFKHLIANGEGGFESEGTHCRVASGFPNTGLSVFSGDEVFLRQFGLTTILGRQERSIMTGGRSAGKKAYTD